MINYSSSSHLSEDFREFLKKDLIEVSSLIQLEQSGRLNWWAETGTCQRLWPIGEYIYLEYRPRQPNWEYTVWIFSATQILREINFAHFEAPKNAIFII